MVLEIHRTSVILISVGMAHMVAVVDWTIGLVAKSVGPDGTV